ncbi:unnamed protein product [Dibothriocephalus latus]|uniref:Uncharacterized protein n=1 Tax=Dibothriocephalus latus TaxID=60516 RepID=A0A3P6TQN3_DIBLA|nr:unnamed protein product [Dibothriocephalus latus]
MDSVNEEPLLDYGSSLAETSQAPKFPVDEFAGLLRNILKSVPQLEANSRANIRGGSFTNRKTQFSSLVLKAPGSCPDIAEPPPKARETNQPDHHPSTSPQFLTAKQQVCF